MPYLTRPEEIITELRTRLDAAKNSLGINTVMIGDDTVIAEYPAIQITAEPTDREVHALRQWKETHFLSIWVYHADFTVDHAQRTIADMELATNVVRFLHEPENRTLLDSLGEPQIIFGYVSRERPYPLRRVKGPVVICTHLTWECQTVTEFPS